MFEYTVSQMRKKIKQFQDEADKANNEESLKVIIKNILLYIKALADGFEVGDKLIKGKEND